jgi:hypothetical protein
LERRRFLNLSVLPRSLRVPRTDLFRLYATWHGTTGTSSSRKGHTNTPYSARRFVCLSLAVAPNPRSCAKSHQPAANRAYKPLPSRPRLLPKAVTSQVATNGFFGGTSFRSSAARIPTLPSHRPSARLIGIEGPTPCRQKKQARDFDRKSFRSTFSFSRFAGTPSIFRWLGIGLFNLFLPWPRRSAKIGRLTQEQHRPRSIPWAARYQISGSAYPGLSTKAFWTFADARPSRWLVSRSQSSPSLLSGPVAHPGIYRRLALLFSSVVGPT